MTDQMNPDDLEAAADRIAFPRYPVTPEGRTQWDEDRYASVSAMRRLAHVLDLADDVIAYHAGHVSTHYEDCYRHHAGCLARVIRDMDD